MREQEIIVHLLPLRHGHALCGAENGNNTAEINNVTCDKCLLQHDHICAAWYPENPE